MTFYIPGLTYRKIHQFCNLGNIKDVNPSWHTALQNQNDYIIQYQQVDDQYYHAFDVRHTQDSNNKNIVRMLGDENINEWCIDCSMIYDIRCSCNKSFMNTICMHAVLVLLSIKDDNYSTPPLKHPADIEYTVNEKYIRINDVTCPWTQLPPTFPGPQFAFCVQDNAIDKWMNHKYNGNAIIIILMYIGCVDSIKTCNICDKFKKMQWHGLKTWYCCGPNQKHKQKVKYLTLY